MLLVDRLLHCWFFFFWLIYILMQFIFQVTPHSCKNRMMKKYGSIKNLRNFYKQISIHLCIFVFPTRRYSFSICNWKRARVENPLSKCRQGTTLSSTSINSRYMGTNNVAIFGGQRVRLWKSQSGAAWENKKKQHRRKRLTFARGI